MTNNYDKLSDNYVLTHEKPDKKYSMVPTALNMLGPLNGKTVIDVGCGDGFFTEIFAKTAKHVIGIDNSIEQIKKAEQHNSPNTTYIHSDMFNFEYPSNDIIFCPFVLNYVQDIDEINRLFSIFEESQNSYGIVGGIVDQPQSNFHDNSKYGTRKTIKNLVEGAEMKVELFNNGEPLVTINSFFHTKPWLRFAINVAGYTTPVWHDPIISQEGIDAIGKEFWEGYIENCDLAYFTARKFN